MGIHRTRSNSILPRAMRVMVQQIVHQTRFGPYIAGDYLDGLADRLGPNPPGARALRGYGDGGERGSNSWEENGEEMVLRVAGGFRCAPASSARRRTCAIPRAARRAIPELRSVTSLRRCDRSPDLNREGWKAGNHSEKPLLSMFKAKGQSVETHSAPALRHWSSADKRKLIGAMT